MGARGELQHRTLVKPCAGWASWVSEPRIVMPDIQSCWSRIGAGSGGTFRALTRGDFPWAGRASEAAWRPKPGEKSDHRVVAMKPAKAGGAKEVMS